MSKGPKAGKAVCPLHEAKSVRFARVVTPRVNKAVKAIKVIGYCAGSSYEYTPKQVEEITQALLAAIKNVNDSFAKKASEQFDFILGK